MRGRSFLPVTLAVALFAFVAGAAVVVFADSGDVVRDRAANPSAALAAGTTDGTALHTHNEDELAELEPDQPLDRATRQVLASQLVTAREVALRYPTVADALAANYRLAGGFAPGSGAHYISFSAAGLNRAGQPLDLEHPLSLIYSGTNPDSEIVGLMYYSMDAQAPEGFAGPNDHWHRHTAVCVKYGPNGIDVPFPADSDVTLQQCRSVGGQYMAQTAWMVHAWVVPGWESPKGVFSHDNPNVRCADGTTNTDQAGFCIGL